MRLKIKLVLAITALVFLITGLVSLVYASQMLHSAVLVFPHPVTGASVRCVATLPPDFRGCLRSLRLH